MSNEVAVVKAPSHPVLINPGEDPMILGVKSVTAAFKVAGLCSREKGAGATTGSGALALEDARDGAEPHTLFLSVGSCICASATRLAFPRVEVVDMGYGSKLNLIWHSHGACTPIS